MAARVLHVHDSDQDAQVALVESLAALDGLRNLTVECGDDPFNYLTPHQLDSMLKLISERLKQAVDVLAMS